MNYKLNCQAVQCWSRVSLFATGLLILQKQFWQKLQKITLNYVFLKMKHPCSQTHYNYSVQLNFLWVHSCQGLVFCVLLVTTHLRKIKAIISILHQNDEKYKLNKNKLNILCSLCKSQEICTYIWLVCLLVGLFRTSWMDLHKHFTRHWDQPNNSEVIRFWS